MENLRIKMEIKNLMELIPHLGPSSDLFAEASTIGRLVFRLLGCCFLLQHVWNMAFPFEAIFFGWQRRKTCSKEKASVWKLHEKQDLDADFVRVQWAVGHDMCVFHMSRYNLGVWRNVYHIPCTPWSAIICIYIYKYPPQTPCEEVFGGQKHTKNTFSDEILQCSDAKSYFLFVVQVLFTERSGLKDFGNWRVGFLELEWLLIVPSHCPLGIGGKVCSVTPKMIFGGKVSSNPGILLGLYVKFPCWWIKFSSPVDMVNIHAKWASNSYKPGYSPVTGL